MTPETREELARALYERSDHKAWGLISDPDVKEWWLTLADAIAPIIERLVAERVAAETERCDGIATAEADDPRNADSPNFRAGCRAVGAAIRSATR